MKIIIRHQFIYLCRKLNLRLKIILFLVTTASELLELSMIHDLTLKCALAETQSEAENALIINEEVNIPWKSDV